jgi:hypothetical protein
MILITLTIVSCGKKDNSDPYIFGVNNINKNWVKSRTYSASAIKFDSIDLSNLSNVTIKNAERNGIIDDCVFTATQHRYNDIYGTFELIHISGDGFVCSQFNGSIGYESANDIKLGYEYFRTSGMEFR